MLQVDLLNVVRKCQLMVKICHESEKPSQHLPLNIIYEKLMGVLDFISGAQFRVGV